MSRATILHWFADNRTILWNAGSLFGTTVVTSGLGFFYWWLAARQFPQTAVGVASAAISAMMFLGSVAVLGLDTLLVGELSRRSQNAGAIITVSLLVTGVGASILGVVFAIAAPTLSPELGLLANDIGTIILFALGVALNSIVIVLDQALIGLFRGGLQLGRNTLFAVIKLVLLAVVSIGLENNIALAIYVTWVLGNLISLAALLLIAITRGVQVIYRPQWILIRKLGRPALSHYVLNLALRAPATLLPIVATVLLSAAISATFSSPG